MSSTWIKWRSDATAALAGGRQGRPRKLEEAGWERAAAWRGQGISDAEIGRRLVVAHTTVARRLGPRLAPDSELVQDADLAQGAELDPEPAAGPGGQLAEAPSADPGPAEAGAAGRVMAGPRIIEGVFASRYAGAMLLHAFGSQAGAGEVLAAAGLAAGTGLRRSADVALLSAASICFALGAATIEQFKHLPAGEAGPLAGLAALPGARTIRPRLAAIAGAGLAVHRTNVARLVMASVGSSLPTMMAPGCHRATHNHTLRRGLVWRLLRSGFPCFRG